MSYLLCQFFYVDFCFFFKNLNIIWINYDDNTIISNLNSEKLLVKNELKG